MHTPYQAPWRSMKGTQVDSVQRLALQNTSLFDELLQRVDELQSSVYSPNRGSEDRDSKDMVDI